VQSQIVIEGAREHNLKNVSLTLPRDALVVLTGVSGSGKSSLAFDTLYAEGQRRYVESLSAYARQFLGQMEKPDVDHISGLSPAISIEQRGASRNPRSTVATTTEIYDYLRLLFARIGRQHCHQCGRPITRQSIDEIVARVFEQNAGQRVQILAPLVEGRKGEYRKELESLKRQGFLRVRIDGEVHSLDEELPALDKKRKHTVEVVVDRIAVDPARRQRLADSLETALGTGKGMVRVLAEDGGEQIFSEQAACTHCGLSFDALHPRNFSFNSPYGACPHCQGLGSLQEFDEDLIVPDPTLPVGSGALVVWRDAEAGWHGSILQAVAKKYGFSLDWPYTRLNARQRRALLHGTNGEEVEVRHQGDRGTVRWRTRFEGIVPNLLRRYRETKSDEMRAWIEKFMSPRPCPQCGGSRLKPETLAVRIGDWNIDRWTRQSVRAGLASLDGLVTSERDLQIGGQVLKEIRERLRFLDDVGLGYLTLERASGTLSGGESQRIRLATQIGSQLMGVLYILDEPSIGLHHRDNERLLRTLLRLRDLGNTVVVVEHDRDTMLAADWLVDLGPGAGRHGGEVVAAGPPPEVMRNASSLTGQYLAGTREIALPPERRAGSGHDLVLEGAAEHNLQDLTVRFPLGRFVCVTGVSGSGKSTLVNEILYRAVSRALRQGGAVPGKHRALRGLEHIDKVVEIDQSPIGRTPRSNAATYTGAFTDVRNLFEKLPEARVRGYGPGRFSFNVKGGRCEACRGDGVVKIEMHFLPDVYVTCEVCRGKRYNRETLEVAFKGKNIADVLAMTVEEACEFLGNIPALRRKLGTLRDVGLGYLHLGQPATTLSGGEAQRVKLATELSRVATGRTLYILDEPTTGLHFEDIRVLLQVLGRLVDAGNTVVVIEHQLDVIKTADHVIDLGPEGGDWGGRLIAEGTPEEVAAIAESLTGVALREVLPAERIGKVRRAARAASASASVSVSVSNSTSASTSASAPARSGRAGGKGGAARASRPAAGRNARGPKGNGTGRRGAERGGAGAAASRQTGRARSGASSAARP